MADLKPFSSLHYNSIQFNSIQFNSIQFNSIQFNSMQFNSIQFNSIQFNSIQFNSIQFKSFQFNSIQSLFVHITGKFIWGFTSNLKLTQESPTPQIYIFILHLHTRDKGIIIVYACGSCIIHLYYAPPPKKKRRRRRRNLRVSLDDQNFYSNLSNALIILELCLVKTRFDVVQWLWRKINYVIDVREVK